MKITDLKSPYRELAEMRREKAPYVGDGAIERFVKKNQIGDAFIWSDTDEGYSFWRKVTAGQQPEIPKSSLDELEAWKKAKGEFNPTMLIEHPDHRLFTAACHVMQGILSNPTFANVFAGNNAMYVTEDVVKHAVELSKALLAELDKTK